MEMLSKAKVTIMTGTKPVKSQIKELLLKIQKERDSCRRQLRCGRLQTDTNW
jgi:hypothetical protein